MIVVENEVETVLCAERKELGQGSDVAYKKRTL